MDAATSPEGQSAARRNPAASLILLLVAWALLRKLQISIASGGFGSDIGEYFRYAAAWAAGGAPYRDYPLEYPPGALPIFLVPLLVSGPARYVKAFVVEMAAFDLAALLLVRALARRAWPADAQRQLIACGGYLVATALLHPVLYSRFDLAPAALTLAALYLFESPWGPALLGLAGAVKLWPLALAPLFLIEAWRAGRTPLALRRLGALLLGLAAPAILVLPRGATGLSGFLQFHATRGLQLESTWATLALLFSSSAHVVDEFGAYHVRCGAACTGMAVLAPIALVLLALAPQLRASRSPKKPEPQLLLRAAAAAVVGGLLGSSVLSPQFLLWAVPLLVLTRGPGTVAVAVVLAALTSLVYPAFYPELVDPLRSGHAAALGFLVARNVILVAAYLSLVESIRPEPALNRAASSV